MNWATLLAVPILSLASMSACAQSRPGSGFNPVQLKDFPRSSLVIQRPRGRDQFQVWLADTPLRQQQGLMWIRELPADHGMLFILPSPRPMSIWMKNTYVSLDILFLAPDGRILKVAPNAKPLSTDTIPSDSDVGGVLELKAGESARRGIRPGDRVLHPAFP
jgi:uncharacterized protein